MLISVNKQRSSPLQIYCTLEGYVIPVQFVLCAVDGAAKVLVQTFIPFCALIPMSSSLECL